MIPLTNAFANRRIESIFVEHGWCGRLQTLPEVSIMSFCNRAMKGTRTLGVTGGVTILSVSIVGCTGFYSPWGVVYNRSRWSWESEALRSELSEHVTRTSNTFERSWLFLFKWYIVTEDIGEIHLTYEVEVEVFVFGATELALADLDFGLVGLDEVWCRKLEWDQLIPLCVMRS